MKGFSEPDPDWLEAATPQVAADTVLLILQTIGSKKWTPGYLDFTQAFHSGDEISCLLFVCRVANRRTSYGVHGWQLLKLKKHCYGSLDGPYQSYVRLQRTLRELGYEQSQAGPCLFLLFNEPEGHHRDEHQERKLEGIIGVAADDLLHGGSQLQWTKRKWTQENYKLGKFTSGDGRFVGREDERRETPSRKRACPEWQCLQAEELMELKRLRSNLTLNQLSCLLKSPRFTVKGNDRPPSKV